MDIIRETADKYQPLFNLMSEDHGLTLTISEMDDIISKVDEVKQLFIPIVSPRTSEIKKAVTEKLNHYKTAIGNPDYASELEQNAAHTLVRELTYLDSICEYEG